MSFPKLRRDSCQHIAIRESSHVLALSDSIQAGHLKQVHPQGTIASVWEDRPARWAGQVASESGQVT